MSRHYIRVTEEKTYAGDLVDAPVSGKSQIYIDYGTQPPNLRRTLSVWNHQSVVPSRGLTNRLTGSDQYAVAGSLQTLLFHEQAEFWKTATFEPTVDGTTKRESLPSYTIDQAIMSNTGIKWTDRFKGCMFTQATISGSNEGTRAPIQLSVNVVGSQRIEVPTPPAFDPAACADLPDSPYRWSKSEVVINGVNLKDLLRNYTLTINHQVAQRINMGQYVTALMHTGWSPSLQATIDLDNWDYKTKHFDLLTSFQAARYGTGNHIKFVDPTTGGDTTFTMYNVMVSQFGENLPVADFFTAGVTLMPYYDCVNLDMTCAYTAVGTP